MTLLDKVKAVGGNLRKNKTVIDVIKRIIFVTTVSMTFSFLSAILKTGTQGFIIMFLCLILLEIDEIKDKLDKK